jgi:hypothetical protein
MIDHVFNSEGKEPGTPIEQPAPLNYDFCLKPVDREEILGYLKPGQYQSLWTILGHAEGHRRIEFKNGSYLTFCVRLEVVQSYLDTLVEEGLVEMAMVKPSGDPLEPQDISWTDPYIWTRTGYRLKNQEPNV